MREKPILFSAPMVRAILAGDKTQTRRIVKLPHNNPLGKWEPTTFGGPNGGRTRKGKTIPLHTAIWHTRTGDSIGAQWVVSDRLWVREAWYCDDYRVQSGPYIKPDDMNVAEAQNDGTLIYRASSGDRPYEAEQPVWRPSIHMPRWASRITLEVAGVRVERLQDISYEDALAEGVPDHRSMIESECAEGETADQLARRLRWPQREYQNLWNAINGPGSWDLNPWVALQTA